MRHDKESIKELLDKNFMMLNSAVREIISGEASLLRLAGGETMTRPGKNMKNIVLVTEGNMKIYREGPEGREAFLYYLGAGEACAFSLICASRHETSEVSIKALEDSTVILLPVPVMETLMKNYKSWYQFVIATYRARFEDLLNAFDSVVFKRLDERLIEYLHAQAEKKKTRTLHLTHQQIADDLHSTREVISRLLKKMEQEGLLAINRNSLLIKKEGF